MATSKDKHTIAVYPNPAHNQITIDYTCATAGTFTLSNSMGQVVSTLLLNGKNHKAVSNVSHLPSGVYYYKCNFSGCANSVGKLIISK